jgi:hypothetical protein
MLLVVTPADRAAVADVVTSLNARTDARAAARRAAASAWLLCIRAPPQKRSDRRAGGMCGEEDLTGRAGRKSPAIPACRRGARRRTRPRGWPGTEPTPYRQHHRTVVPNLPAASATVRRSMLRVGAPCRFGNRQRHRRRTISPRRDGDPDLCTHSPGEGGGFDRRSEEDFTGAPTQGTGASS